MNWFKEIFTAPSGMMSSKRISGVAGIIVCLGVLIYCTIKVIEAPALADTVLLTSSGLLGVDSVASIWKKHGQNV